MKNPNTTQKNDQRYCTRYWHKKAQKWMIASEYGYKAWPFGGGKKK